MEWLADPNVWMGFLTLVVLEIVLGIDNLVFIAILADRLPPEQRDRARMIGLSLALVMRLGLLAVMSYIVTLTKPLFPSSGYDLSGRDLILIVGGFFLLFKATMELHERLEGDDNEADGPRAYASFGVVVAQIVVLDAVFSLDAVITAVGMVDHLEVMMAAVIVSMAMMMLASKPLTAFVSRHPTVVMLCLGFLLMIGFSLLAEGLGFKVPKGYLYAAIGFSILIESFNQWARFSRERRSGTRSLRQRTAEAVIRLLAPQERTSVAAAADIPSVAAAAVDFVDAERDMIRSVLSLAERPVQTVMTPRADIVWLDLELDHAELARRIIAEPRIRLPAARGDLDRLEGIVQSHDLLVHLLAGKPFDLQAVVQKPLLVPEGISALRVLERIRTHPIPMAVVVDEYGSVRGLVTANDLLATIAGDLADTQEIEEGARQEDGDHSWTVDATLSLDDLERATGIELERQGGYFTLSGLILHRLDRIPEVGDHIELGDWRVDVLEVEKRRVVRARLSPKVGMAS